MLKKSRFFIIICAFGILTLIPAFSKYQDLAQRDRKVQAKMKQVASENNMLAHRQYKLQTDPVFAESVARQKLNVAKEDEVIYKVTP
jgi:cell division protein FtsB